MEPTDAELVDAYRAGSVTSLEALVERHGRPLMGYIRGMTRDTAEAEDVFQDVWFRVIRKLNGHYRHGFFRAWLTTIAHNLLVDRYRRRRPTVSLDEEPEDGVSLADRLAAPEPGPEKEADLADLADRVARAVQQLPPTQREVFLMRTQQHLSFADIAELLDIPLNTALGRMHYAVTRLRKELTRP
jgi:RNA polymerase sigma-70 factor (ECF subfamily)